mmetsp:Transcript_25110/g.40232  ORF Transcript_25110/g.40232 Transcript_25110/m.40232 type:complete len:155 (+) Transcript_25110:257-721(+)
MGYDQSISMMMSPGVAIVKNTFIDVPVALMYELSTAFPLARSRSEPDLAIFFDKATKIRVQASKFERGLSDSTTMVPEDSRSIQDGTRSELPLLLSKDEEHRLGQCRPCSYFVLKKDGCRQGDDCPFCHICSYKEVKDRKKQLKGKTAHQNRRR